MTSRAPLLVLAAALFGAVSGCTARADQPDDRTVVARVGDAEITLDEVAEAFADATLRVGQPADVAALDGVLNTLVHRQLLIEEARDQGIEETEAYRAARDLAETKVLVDRYTATAMADDLAVEDEDLRRAFVQMNTTYRARHLYARTESGAEALRARLDAGETFEDIAAETFADSTLAASGGSLGDFGHDDMDPAFEAAAFRLPVGEVSEPVRTATGWSILRVDAKATNPLLTEDQFATKIDQLTRYVRKRKRTEARFRLSRDTRDALAPRFEEAAFDRLVAFATGVAPNLDAEALARWRRTPLVRFSSSHLGGSAGGATEAGGVWTVGDVEDRAASMTERQREAVQDAASLRDFIEGLLVREELAAKARAQGLDGDARFARIVDAQMDEWVFDAAKRRLRLVDDIPADSLRAHFEAHRADYEMPIRIRASEILVERRALADSLRTLLAGGADFADLARRHSMRPGAATAGGDLGEVTRAQLGRLAGPVFDAAPGEVVGPVEVAGRYALVLRGETLPPRPMTFAEAAPLVRDALDIPFAQRRLVAAVGRLRDRYPVTIDRDALAPLLDAVRTPIRPAS